MPLQPDDLAALEQELRKSEMINSLEGHRMLCRSLIIKILGLKAGQKLMLIDNAKRIMDLPPRQQESEYDWKQRQSGDRESGEEG